MDKIYSLVEAFSMQPQTIHVGMMMRGGKVDHIITEAIYSGDNIPDFYVGYNEKGKKLFQILIKSVNVIYQ